MLKKPNNLFGIKTFGVRIHSKNNMLEICCYNAASFKWISTLALVKQIMDNNDCKTH